MFIKGDKVSYSTKNVDKNISVFMIIKGYYHSGFYTAFTVPENKEILVHTEDIIKGWYRNGKQIG